jgi:hypothetical protein
MTDNSEQTLTLSVEEAARLLGISPGLAYELRSFSGCACRQSSHPAIVKAKFRSASASPLSSALVGVAGGTTAWEHHTDGRLVTEGVMGVARSLGDSGEKNAAVSRISRPRDSRLCERSG